MTDHLEMPLRESAVQPALWQAGCRYEISLSTMWGMKRFENFTDLLSAGSALGLAGIELNHQVKPAMLEGLNLRKFPVRSIHEPCPAEISTDEQKKQDLLISSPDEERRREGVNLVRKSIDLAKDIGAGSVVIHCGMVQMDLTCEKRLIALFEAGKGASAEYAEIKEGMISARKERVAPCIQAVLKSLGELLAHAGGSGVRLGLENRYHFFDLPSPDEMALFLNLAEADRLGMVYDTGHAQALDRLGFYPRKGWLERFDSRIIGAHLHDAIGISDHLAPGLGEIDFHEVAAHLPATAFRTLEIKPHNTSDQLENGLKVLMEAGCIHPCQGD